ncbi:MAG TPA: hypothetical protein VK473_19765 [Terriglobales bacterium]|nr:hypothetical protein [Terriglobales bacterium]
MLSCRLARIAFLLLSSFVLISPSPAFAWGDEGHTAINRTAALKVPPNMPLFLRRSADRIAYLGPEPDRWREKSEYALKNSQEPDHFIDLERVDDLQEFSSGRYEFYQWLYAKRARLAEHSDDYLPERVGLQPYITMEIYGRLKAAFREYRRLRQEHKPTAIVEQNIVFYAGWLGHYVADASNPLHTTIHFNGWIGDNPNGYTTAKDIHWKFEGTFVAAHLARLKFADLVARPAMLQDPFHDYIRYLRDSHRLVEQVYQIEKNHGLEGEGSPEAIDFIRHRLAAGSQMLLNLWYTAWQESAEPAPSQVKKVP